jgi:RimJ/RimL family protein N-acetyltransferase
MQYAPSRSETEATMTALINYCQELPTVPDFGYKVSTVNVNEEFAGHISRHYYLNKKGGQRLQLGWNLIPELWGQGIMARAVRLLLDQQFDAHPELECIVFCFRSNSRCRRVMEKIGFQPTRASIGEVIQNFAKTLGRQKLLKFHLSAKDYDRRQS